MLARDQNCIGLALVAKCTRVLSYRALLYSVELDPLGQDYSLVCRQEWVFIEDLEWTLGAGWVLKGLAAKVEQGMLEWHEAGGREEASVDLVEYVGVGGLQLHAVYVEEDVAFLYV